MLTPSQQILPPGMPGYRRFTLYPHNMAKARRLVAAADPADRQVTVWANAESPNREAAAYYRAQLQKIGLRARLKVVGGFGYTTAIGNRSTPNLDTGWANWFADYAHPDNFFRPVLAGSSIRPRDNYNFAQLNVPGLDTGAERLNARPLTPGRERAYAKLDRSHMRLAPWVPYGNSTTATFVSKEVDLADVAWNPLFGADLASFRFGG
jgi:peptide/nickel transport system substrate-binding protein